MKRRGRLLIIVIMLIIMGCMSISVKGAETKARGTGYIPIESMAAVSGSHIRER